MRSGRFFEVARGGDWAFALRVRLSDWRPRGDFHWDRPTPRDTFLLVRGAWDQHGEKLTPGVPELLGKLPKDAPANRLALAGDRRICPELRRGGVEPLETNRHREQRVSSEVHRPRREGRSPSSAQGYRTGVEYRGDRPESK